nr:MAG TPA: putative tail fiber protein [Caudoviricetes sp.]
MEVEGLLNRAEQIRDEHKDGANTAKRVGSLMVDMVKSFGSQSLEILGHYDTLEELKQAYPQGPKQNGMYAVGEKPYNYYAYYDGNWQDQGKLVEPLSVYLSPLSFSTIINEDDVPQYHLTEINAIYEAWKSGRMVYVLDEKGEYYNLGVLNMQLAEDNSKCSFVALNQDGVLCYYSCSPSSGVTGKWSVTPIGKDLFALIKHTHKASDVAEETNKRFVTDEEKNELSTLSTVYAKADLSNAMTVSLGQNGYAKFNNGLLIQWGYFSAGASNNQSINFPVSFKSCFSLAFSSSTDNTDNSIWSVNYAAIYASYFTVYRRYANAGSVSPSSQSFRWIAIGSWK